MSKHLGVRLAIVVVIVSAVIGSMIFVPSSDAQEKVITLQLSNFLPATQKMSVLIDEYCKDMAKRTNGRVKIVHYPGATLTPPAQTYDSVMQGIADMGLTVPGYSRGRFPLHEVLDLPLGVKSATLGTRMYNAYFKKFKPKEFDGVKMLWLFSHGPGLLHTKKPVNKLEDMKGLKIRALSTVTKIVSSLGATPVSMPQTETYDALQKGIADGMCGPYETMEGWRFAEVTKYSIENYGSSYVAGFIVFMNKDKWNTLPKDIQEIFEKMSEEYIEKSGKVWDEIDTSGRKFVQAKGNKIITLTPAEDQRWANQLVGIKDEYVKSMKAKGLPGDEALKFCNDYIKNNQK